MSKWIVLSIVTLSLCRGATAQPGSGASVIPKSLSTGEEMRFWVQPDEEITVSCDMRKPLTGDPTVTVRVVKGVDADADDLIATGDDAPETSGNKVIVKVLGADRVPNAVYQIHILATTTSGDSVACDLRCDVIEIRYKPQ